MRKVQKTHRKHGPECNPWSPKFNCFSKQLEQGTYEKLYSWYRKLRDMRKILGMTKEEDDQLAAKVGLPEIRYTGEFFL